MQNFLCVKRIPLLKIQIFQDNTAYFQLLLVFLLNVLQLFQIHIFTNQFPTDILQVAFQFPQICLLFFQLILISDAKPHRLVKFTFIAVLQNLQCSRFVLSQNISGQRLPIPFDILCLLLIVNLSLTF